MQIACPELYEREKKANEGEHVGKLYHQTYRLSKKILHRYRHWVYTDFVFDINADNILVCLYYRTHGERESGGFGRIEYSFYVVENNGDYYIRYFDLWNAESVADKCGKEAIENIAACDTFDIGIRTKKYRDFIKAEAMSEKIPVDREELDNQFRKMQSTDFKGSIIDFLDYIRATTVVEMVDFRNRKTFHSDEYVLPKYSAHIDFIEFIFEKCSIPILKKCNLQYIDDMQEAKAKLIDRELRQKYHMLW